jgi:hypothetical protein
MVQSETEFAVPSTSVLGKAAVLGDARPGTFAGEFMRSTLMYKNFAVTLFHTHLMRMATETGAWNKLRYASSLIVSTTLMGALALQLKDLARGKDPRPMLDPSTGLSPKFVMAALLQGGGLGLFGDFLFAGSDRFGHSKLAAAAGPMAGFASDVIDLTLGNAVDAMSGLPANIGRDAVQFAGRYTPGASLWYARLALERGVLDALQRAVDPNAEKSFKSRQQAWAREQAASYWSPPGGGIARAPDFGNALRSFTQGQTVAKGRIAGVAVDGQSPEAIAAATEAAKAARRRGVDVTGRTAAEIEQAIAADRAAKKAARHRGKPQLPGTMAIPP